MHAARTLTRVRASARIGKGGRLAQRLEHPAYTGKVVRSNRTSPTMHATGS